MKNFDVLDDVPFVHRSLLLVLCGLTCCWGFVNNTILLVFASKIGFPLAVTACSIGCDRNNSLKMIYYTLLLVVLGCVFFYFYNVEIDTNVIKNFHPSIIDLLLAVGLGGALKTFWDHKLRINVIIMSAGLASLLPACIMTGYFISINDVVGLINSFTLYLEYVVGIVIGSMIFTKKLNNEHN
jgi:hypothetical protein